MTQRERRVYLIRELLREQPEYQNVVIPETPQEQKDLLRALMNLRPPQESSESFLEIQNAYLQQAIAERGIIDTTT